MPSDYLKFSRPALERFRKYVHELKDDPEADPAGIDLLRVKQRNVDINLHGLGHFFCASCKNKWKSNYASVSVQVKGKDEFRVFFFFQKCQRCDDLCVPSVKKIKQDEWRYIVERLVKVLEARRDNIQSSPRKKETSEDHKNHRTQDCGRCKYGDEHLHP